MDSAFTTGAGLYAGSISLTSDSYVSEATLKAPTTVASIEGATVKYYVKLDQQRDESEKGYKQLYIYWRYNQYY